MGKRRKSAQTLPFRSKNPRQDSKWGVGTQGKELQPASDGRGGHHCGVQRSRAGCSKDQAACGQAGQPRQAESHRLRPPPSLLTGHREDRCELPHRTVS